MDTLTLYVSLFAIVQSVVTLAGAWIVVNKIADLSAHMDEHLANLRRYSEDCELTRTRYLVEVQASR